MSDVEFVFMSRKHNESFGRDLCEEWLKQIAEQLSPEEQKRIAVVQSSLQKLEPPYSHFDCIVSPANSYGIMDGGFDYYLSEAFSPKNDFTALTRAAQSAIKKNYFGFAPPGTCTLVTLTENLRTNAQYPYCKMLAVCPTMRHPMGVGWHQDLVYNTMWSLLTSLERWNESFPKDSKDRISKVAMTGLATGVGGIPAEVCAKQMILAMKHFWNARSEEGRKRWSDPQFPGWNDVEPIAKEVDQA